MRPTLTAGDLPVTGRPDRKTSVAALGSADAAIPPSAYEIGSSDMEEQANPSRVYLSTTDPVASPLRGPRALGHSDGVATRDGKQAGPALDEVSLKIVEQLQQDGRRSYAAIGKAVGLSEAAVRQRVQKLLEQDAVRIVAVADPLTAGFLRQAMVGITADGDVEPVADALAGLDEVGRVAVTAGSFDLLAEVVCRDDAHLLELVTKRIRALPGVRATESFVYLKLRKQTCAWGTR